MGYIENQCRIVFEAFMEKLEGLEEASLEKQEDFKQSDIQFLPILVYVFVFKSETSNAIISQ